MSTRVTHITTTYTASDTFEIPDDVFLLSKEENEKANVSDYGAWYIRYSTLYYIGKDGKERQIEGEQADDDEGIPDDIETEERSVTSKSDPESESESEDEWEEVYNGDDLPGVPYEHAGLPGRFYQTYGNGGGPGGSGGYWVRQGGQEVWKVEGTILSFVDGYRIEVRPKVEAEGVPAKVYVYRAFTA